MRTSILTCAITVLIVGQTSGHFLLNYPPGIGFDDDIENESPCGGFTPDFTKDNVTDFHVDGDTLALTSIHPQATWLFRATLDTTAGGNWTNLLPAVLQTGLGAFCEKTIVVPSSWAGSKGLLGIVQDAPDGVLYQCAAVNFVSGAATIIPSTCTNVTGLTAAFTADAVLSSLPASFVSSAASSPTGSASSSSTAKSSASTIHSSSYSVMGTIVWVGVVGSATFLACLW